MTKPGKIVYGPFGKSSMQSTLDFCPRPARKETNVPLNKRTQIQQTKIAITKIYLSLQSKASV
jgi:hypothetical protein